MPTPKAKAQNAGDKLVAAILADMAEQHLEPDAREAEVLARARAAADKIERLEAAVERAGLTFTDKDGVTRPSPILAEIRSTTLVLTRCLNMVQMEPDRAGKDPAKVRAGQASWTSRSTSRDMRGAIPR